MAQSIPTNYTRCIEADALAASEARNAQKVAV